MYISAVGVTGVSLKADNNNAVMRHYIDMPFGLGCIRIVTLIRTDIRTKSKKYQNLLHSVLFVPMVVCGLKFIIDNKAGVYLLCDSQPHGKVGLNYCNGLEF